MKALRRALGAALALLATACATALEDRNWIEVRSPNFQLFSNLPAPAAVQISQRLEVFREALRQITTSGKLEERLPTYVFAFKDAAGFGSFSPKRGVVGYLNPTSHATYMAFNASGSQLDALEVLQHEYTHFMQYNKPGFNYPPWYEEGLAELLSTLRVTDSQVEIGRVPSKRVHSLGIGSQYGYWLPLGRVMRTRSLDHWPPPSIDMFYGESWALTHFLHAGHLVGYPNRLQVMQRYLEALNRGQSHDEAFAAAFDVSEAKLEQELLLYLRHKVPFLQLPRAKFEVAVDPSVRPLERARQLLQLGDLALQFTFDEQPSRAAAATSEQAFRGAIAASPELPLAHAGLALALRALARAGGDASLARALELAPDDPLVCLYAAEYLLPVRGSSDPIDRERLTRARGVIRHGLEVAPDSPALNLALGRSYLLQGEDVAQAVGPLERSQRLLRWDMEGALALGEAYARTDARDAARRVLTRVVNGTHDERQREHANKLLAGLGDATSGEQ